MEIDWLEVGRGAALVLAGAGAAIGVIRKWFTETAGSRASSPAHAGHDEKLLPAVLSALEAAKDASDEAAEAVRAVSLTAAETQRTLASLIGALREIVDRLTQVEGRLRRTTARGEKTEEHRRRTSGAAE